MAIPERRQTPRTVMERLAYINIEPNNGGIVLNVSDEGLCFHSIARVERNGKLRFSLLEQNRRIEADGELAWMDEAQKVGGVRFAALSSEAREQIDNWIAEPSTPLVGGGERGRSFLDLHSFSGIRPSLPGAAAAPASALASSREATTAGRLSGFSGGLAIGLLIAALVTAGFLVHNNRSQLGESLIRVGERLASKPQVQPESMAQAPPPVSIQDKALSSPIILPSPALTPPSSQQKPVAQLSSKTEPLEGKTVTHVPTSLPITVAKNSSPAPSPASIAPPVVTSQGNGINRISGLLSDKPGSLPRLETPDRSNVLAVDSGTDTSGATSRMYFEVGKFKEQLWARRATDELSHLGFPATIAQKSRLWKNSYYVLVGPYADRDEAETVHKDLASRGFKPRPFERGSRNFTLSSRVTLNGTEMPVGEFLIRWESYVPDAKVKFLQNDDLVVSVDGRWVDRGVKNERNAFVYEKRGDGSRTLLEIRFAGMSRVLVFPKPS